MRLSRLAPPLALIAGAFALYYLCVRPLHCLRTLRAVEERTALALTSDNFRAVRIANENILRLKAVRTGCRTSATFYVLLGVNENLLGREPEAIADFRRALEVDDRPEIYYNIGMAALSQGRLDEAVRELATAVEFQPYMVDSLSGELRARVETEVKARAESP